MNNQQIKLVQMAAKGAGLRGGRFNPDRRYYLLLSQYRQPNGKLVTSCKQLTRANLDDFLAICESLGWRHPGKSSTFYRDKIQQYARDAGNLASYGSREAIRHLAGDLGWSDEHLKNFINDQTKGLADGLTTLSHHYAWKIIEALKAILGRRDGKEYKTLADVAQEYQTTNKHEGHEK